jgi:hypothetical protein
VCWGLLDLIKAHLIHKTGRNAIKPQGITDSGINSLLSLRITTKLLQNNTFASKRYTKLQFSPNFRAIHPRKYPTIYSFYRSNPPKLPFSAHNPEFFSFGTISALIVNQGDTMLNLHNNFF